MKNRRKQVRFYELMHLALLMKFVIAEVRKERARAKSDLLRRIAGGAGIENAGSADVEALIRSELKEIRR